MKKIFYNNDGWICNRYPYDLKIDDENRFIEVDDETFEKTLSVPVYFAWRVVDGELVCDQYEDEPEERKFERLRKSRKPLLAAFDIGEKAVLRKRELDDKNIMQGYHDLLDLKDDAFENIPDQIKKYF